MRIECMHYEDLLHTISDESIDLVCIDPPYAISHKSGFSGISDSNGLGRRFVSYSTDFGDWDKPIALDHLFQECYRVLKQGGSMIVWYAEWKMQELLYYASMMKFKQPRLCFWLKCNPVPINQKVNYLTNGYEAFATFVKGSKPTFNSSYDNGIYQYPIVHGKEREDHPTQKPLYIIEDLIKNIQILVILC